MDEFEIYFKDLNEQTQLGLLMMAGVKDPKDMNWDVFPVASVPVAIGAPTV
jgi:hypothetical protein